MTITLSIDDIFELGACSNYPRERIEALARGQEQWTLLEIIEREDIPVEDRIWLGTHQSVIGTRWSIELGCDFASRVLPIYEQQYPGDMRPRRTIDVSRRHARGDASEKEWRESRFGAFAAFGDYASYAAAYNDSVSATWAASAAAAYAASAANNAACDTCGTCDTCADLAAADAANSVAIAAADADSARIAEREWQLGRIREVLAEIEGEDGDTGDAGCGCT